MTIPAAPVIVYLSGDQQGTTQRLSGTQWLLGTSDQADIRFVTQLKSPVGEHHATLVDNAGNFSLQAHEPHRVWVNGQSAPQHALASGDLIELGAGGPLLRFRLHPAGSPPFKTMRQAVSDCYQSAARRAGSAVSRLTFFSGEIVRELLTGISPLARFLAFTLLALLVGLVVTLAVRSDRLEDKLEVEARNVAGLEELLSGSALDDITADDLEAIRRDLESRIASTSERVDFLEERAGAAQRTVAEASRSVVFVQGSYGFRDTASGQPLRMALSADGKVVVGPDGSRGFTTSGDGPLVEAFFTGTGFVATADGLLVTNRHVALPWEFDRDAQRVVEQGLEPRMHRMIGYLADQDQPFDLELVQASDAADLAVLKCSAVTADVRPLAFDPTPPRVGAAVLVLGFPTGIQAMLARADPSFVEQISGQRIDFWEIAQRLASAGQIGPLATRGIIGQATAAAIVYDADTTSGGSGGPVLGLDGRVVAITTAVLPQFGGSNIGVPAALAIDLLELAEQTVTEVAPEPID